jgi:hypothetical protein
MVAQIHRRNVGILSLAKAMRVQRQPPWIFNRKSKLKIKFSEPVDNRHVEIVCAASARVNVRIFYQPLTAPTGLGLLASPRGGALPGRAARGPAPRKMACRPLAGKQSFAVQGHQLAHRGGAAWSLPLLISGEQ